MKQVIYRKNKMFTIDRSQIIAPNGDMESICNALYAAVYTEFIGASENPNYKNQTNLVRLQSLNTFAYNWLKSRGFIQ